LGERWRRIGIKSRCGGIEVWSVGFSNRETDMEVDLSLRARDVLRSKGDINVHRPNLSEDVREVGARGGWRGRG
jgi:hypothetical protein